MKDKPYAGERWRGTKDQLKLIIYHVPDSIIFKTANKRPTLERKEKV